MTIQRQTHFQTFPRYLSGDDLAAAFPPNQRAHVHAFYLAKRNAVAAECREVVRQETQRMIIAIRKERGGPRP